MWVAAHGRMVESLCVVQVAYDVAKDVNVSISSSSVLMAVTRRCRSPGQSDRHRKDTCNTVLRLETRELELFRADAGGSVVAAWLASV